MAVRSYFHQEEEFRNKHAQKIVRVPYETGAGAEDFHYDVTVK